MHHVDTIGVCFAGLGAVLATAWAASEFCRAWRWRAKRKPKGRKR